MKKPEEIEKGLECCAEYGNCSEGCPYNQIKDCGHDLYSDALAYIQQLERERDAAVKELYGKCPYCINYTPNGFIKCFNLATCKHIGNGGADDNWQWRGVQEVE